MFIVSIFYAFFMLDRNPFVSFLSIKFNFNGNKNSCVS